MWTSVFTPTKLFPRAATYKLRGWVHITPSLISLASSLERSSLIGLGWGRGKGRSDGEEGEGKTGKEEEAEEEKQG